MEQQLSMSKQSIEQHELFINQLEEDDAAANVRSAYSGEILEIMVDRGEMISPGLPMFKLIQKNKNQQLRGVLFVAAKDGKRIKNDMDAHISPVTIKPQEFGYMKAKVNYVSEYPQQVGV